MDFMNGTQPSRFKRLAAAIAHFPRTLAALLGVTVRDLDALDGKGCGGLGGITTGCNIGRFGGLGGGSGERQRFALPTSQGLESFSSLSAT